MYCSDPDMPGDTGYRTQPRLILFDDSCLIRLSRMGAFPLPSTVHSWVSGISIIIWLLAGYLIAIDVIVSPAEILSLLTLAAVIFIASWLIAVAREDRSRQAFVFLNKCRRQMIHFAKFLDAVMSDNNRRAKRLFAERGYEMPAEKSRDCIVLSQIENILYDRSAAIKRLLLSGTRGDLKSALSLLKSPFVIGQSASVADGMVIPLENLSAMVLTLLQGIESDMEDETHRNKEQTGLLERPAKVI